MWLHSLKVAQLLRSAACLHTNQSRSYLSHLVFSHFVCVLPDGSILTRFLHIMSFLPPPPLSPPLSPECPAQLCFPDIPTLQRRVDIIHRASRYVIELFTSLYLSQHFELPSSLCLQIPVFCSCINLKRPHVTPAQKLSTDAM